MKGLSGDGGSFYDHLERLKNVNHEFKINLLTKLDSVIK